MSPTRSIFDSTVKRRIQDHYDKEAATYDSEELIDRRPENDDVFQHYLRKALGAGRREVLDVGGGTGRVAIPGQTMDTRWSSWTYRAECSCGPARNPENPRKALACN